MLFRRYAGLSFLLGALSGEAALARSANMHELGVTAGRVTASGPRIAIAGRSPTGPTPAPVEKSPAATSDVAQPPAGKYGCHFTRYGSIVPSGDMIAILSPGIYHFFDRGEGRFTTAAGGRLTWITGPLAGADVEGTFYHRSSDDKPAIKLIMKGIGKDHLGRSYDQTNYCIHRGQ